MRRPVTLEGGALWMVESSAGPEDKSISVGQQGSDWPHRPLGPSHRLHPGPPRPLTCRKLIRHIGARYLTPTLAPAGPPLQPSLHLAWSRGSMGDVATPQPAPHVECGLLVAPQTS